MASLPNHPQRGVPMNKTLASARCAIPASLRFHLIAGALVALTVFTLSIGAAAQTEKVLYSFNGVNAGGPYSLTVDAAGNLYGVSSYTPTHKYGAVFKLTKGPTGHWSMTVLYDFRGAADGEGPNGNLVFDAVGNLYGTTEYGGGVYNCSCGVVFELSPTASGPWKETTLYSFKGGTDGALPQAGVIFDAAGNLYGTAASGGVFELSPNSQGGWTKTAIYAFKGGSDGLSSYAPLVFDQSGNLYGVTEFGGGIGSCYETWGCGTVFELTPNSGSWTEKVLYAFTGQGDGGDPFGGLVIDNQGNLYGVTAIGGNLSGCGGSGCGTVFELSLGSDGLWTESNPYAFLGGDDGAYPQAQLAISGAVHFYGVATQGGSACGCGTVFELSKTQHGWAESTVHQFAGGSDGAYPYGGVVFNKQGTIFGATGAGGTNNQGTVFNLIQ